MTPPKRGNLALKRQAGALIVAMAGELDLSNAPTFEAEIRAGLGEVASVIIDLTRVTYFDSSGVRMLDHIAEASGQRGLELRIVAPSDGRARQILRICAFREELLFETLAEAMESLRGT